MQIEWQAVLGALGFTFMGASLFAYVVGHYWLRFKKFERERDGRSLPADAISARLKKIEEIVEATSVEVERIAEAQRFQSRLLADKATTSSS